MPHPCDRRQVDERDPYGQMYGMLTIQFLLGRGVPVPFCAAERPMIAAETVDEPTQGDDMARISFQHVTRHFSGAEEPAVDAVDLEVADGETVALVGPAGAGKTTLLRLAGGLEVPDTGRVLLGDPPDGDVDVVVVLLFQNYAIYPNLSVRDNIVGPVRHQSPQEVDATLDEVVELLGLGGLTRRPGSSLSVSERMRVAVARSFVRRPGVLLRVEPLANLEPQVRTDVRACLVAAQQAFRVTTLYATEDPGEAAAVADRVVHVEGGRVREPGACH